MPEPDKSTRWTHMSPRNLISSVILSARRRARPTFILLGRHTYPVQRHADRLWRHHLPTPREGREIGEGSVLPSQRKCPMNGISCAPLSKSRTTTQNGAFCPTQYWITMSASTRAHGSHSRSGRRQALGTGGRPACHLSRCGSTAE